MSVYFENFIDADGELRPPLFLRVPEIAPRLDGGPHTLCWDQGGWFWGNRLCRVGPFLDIGLAALAADMAVLGWLSDNGFWPQLSTGGLDSTGKPAGYNVRLLTVAPHGGANPGDPFFGAMRAEALNAAAHEAQTHLLAAEEL